MYPRSQQLAFGTLRDPQCRLGNSLDYRRGAPQRLAHFLESPLNASRNEYAGRIMVAKLVERYLELFP
jgi:hypothetical protein